MKKHRSIIVVLLMALTGTAPGQNPPLPGVSAPALTETQKWLAAQDAQWQAAFKRDVGDPRAADLDKLKLQYLTSIQAGITKAQGAGDLETALAWRNEQKRFSEANEVPAQDDASDPMAVKQLRAGWRTQVAQIEKEYAARAKAMHGRYDQILSQTQTQLTQRGSLDDAVLVKARREEVASAWLGGLPAVTAEVPKTAPTIPVAPSAVKKPGKAGGRDFAWPGRVAAADVSSKSAGDFLFVEGTVKKIIPPSLATPDRYYVQLEPDVLCEFNVQQSGSRVRVEPSGVSRVGYKNSLTPIVKPGDSVSLTGRYEGQGFVGAVKGPMLRGCSVLSRR